MAIVFDNAEQEILDTDTTVHTISLTIGSGSDRMLAGLPAYEYKSPQTGDNATSVTYNGTNLIFSTRSSTGPIDHAEAWYLGEASLPSSGTYNLVATWATAKRRPTCGGIIMTGVKDQAPEAAASNNNTSNVSSGSISITTVTNNAWLAGVIAQGQDETLSFDTAIQRQFDRHANSACQNGTELITSSGATTFDWSSTGSKRWAGSVMAFEAAAAAGGNAPTGNINGCLVGMFGGVI